MRTQSAPHRLQTDTGGFSRPRGEWAPWLPGLRPAASPKLLGPLLDGAPDFMSKVWEQGDGKGKRRWRWGWGCVCGGSTGLFPTGPGFGKHSPCLAPRHSPQAGTTKPTDAGRETLNGSCGVPDTWRPRGDSWKRPERPWSELGSHGARQNGPQLPEGQRARTAPNTAQEGPPGGPRADLATRGAQRPRLPPTLLPGAGVPWLLPAYGGSQHPEDSRSAGALTCQ